MTARDGKAKAVKDAKGKVTDWTGSVDTKEIDIDIDDAADEAPRFVGKTKYTVNQEQVGAKEDNGKLVYVVQLSEAWSDKDSDDDDLRFDVGGKGNLPSWIKVYGPDDWEDIYDRQDDVREANGPDGIRDRDQAIAIVIDRDPSGAYGTPPKTNGGSNAQADVGTYTFTLSATDDDGNTERDAKTGKKTPTKITIEVKDTNVDIVDTSKTVTISGKAEVGATITPVFNSTQDPDLPSGTSPVMAVYTLQHDNGTPVTTANPDADDDDVTVSVSAMPKGQKLVTADVGRAYTASVTYYEMDPVTGGISVATVTSAATDAVKAVPATPANTTLTLDEVTSTNGLSVTITASDATYTGADNDRLVLEASTNGTSGWLSKDTVADLTYSNGSVTVSLDVDGDGDGTNGDGGGLYYRVVHEYETTSGTTTTSHRTPIGKTFQLGDLADPDGNSGLNGVDNNNNVSVGNSLTVLVGGKAVAVQWQGRNDTDRDGSLGDEAWMNISGATGTSYTVTNAYSQLRAKVMYKDDADNANYISWIEYSPVANKAAAANTIPAATQTGYEVRVNLPQAATDMESNAVVTGDLSKYFVDADGDSLTYSIDSYTGPDWDGTGDGLQTGNTVYLKPNVDEVRDADDNVTTAAVPGEVLFSVDPKTGKFTYATDRDGAHDNNATEGQGNVISFLIKANDGTGDSTSNLTVTVRVNVAPSGLTIDTPADTAAVDLAALVDNKTTTAVNESVHVIQVRNTADNANIDFAVDEHTTTVATNLGTLNAVDENLVTDMFGMHDITVSDTRFEIRAGEDGSQGVLWLKAGEVFDYENDGDKKGTLTLTITAKDGGGAKVSGKVSIHDHGWRRSGHRRRLRRLRSDAASLDSGPEGRHRRHGRRWRGSGSASRYGGSGGSRLHRRHPSGHRRRPSGRFRGRHGGRLRHRVTQTATYVAARRA